MVTAVAAGPLDGDRLVSVGATLTVYGSALLARPPTVTTTLPLVAPAGTGTTMLLADHDVGVAAVPLNVTVLVPLVAPKLLPLMVTAVATGRSTARGWSGASAAPTRVRECVAGEAGDSDDNVAGGRAGRYRDDDAAGGPRRRRRGGAVESDGAGALGCAEVGAADRDGGATGPLDGERLVSVGVGETVNGSVLLARPPTVTTTLPVVAPEGTGTTMLLADQVVGVAAVPLKVTVLRAFRRTKIAAADGDGSRRLRRSLVRGSSTSAAWSRCRSARCSPCHRR